MDKEGRDRVVADEVQYHLTYRAFHSVHLARAFLSFTSMSDAIQIRVLNI
jgi:hypothetical protein